jgi:hypothetical protein
METSPAASNRRFSRWSAGPLPVENDVVFCNAIAVFKEAHHIINADEFMLTS